MRNYKITAVLILSAAILLSACATDGASSVAAVPNSTSASSSSQVSSSSEPEFEANPKGAIDEIYLDIDMMGLVDAQDEDITDRFLISLDDIESYSVKYSMGRFGVADTYIIKPAKGKEDEIENKLLDIKDSRINEFEKYNVMDSYPISQGAEVYTRGDYIIMVMHKDNSSVKEIIKKYIPS